MNLNSKCSALAKVRVEIFAEMDAALKAQLLELMELRERLREAEVSTDIKKTAQVRKPVLIYSEMR